MAVIVLAASFAYNLSLYGNIPDHWKVTIGAFIIFLPFCYFLQALLNAKSYKIQHISQIQKDLRECYFTIQDEVEDIGRDYLTIERTSPTLTPSTETSGREMTSAPNIKYVNIKLLLYDSIFRTLFLEISRLIRNVELYDYYQKGYHIYIKNKQQLFENEIQNELILRLRKYESRASDYEVVLMTSEIRRRIMKAATPEQAPTPPSEQAGIQIILFSDLQELLIRDVVKTRFDLADKILLKRSELLQFELGDIVDDIVEEKMHGGGINFRSYFLPLSSYSFISQAL